MTTKIENKFLPFEMLDEKSFLAIKQYADICDVGNHRTPLFYEDQTPIVAYVVIKGYIQILKNGKIKKVLRQGHIIGLNELINDLTSSYAANALPHAKIGFLDKSKLAEIFSVDNELSQALNKILEDSSA